MSISRRFWITGATEALGLALVNHALEQGHRVAISSKDNQLPEPLGEAQHSVLRLPGQLHESGQDASANQRLEQNWGALDTLLINAGVCDYLPAGLAQDQLFEAIASSNLRATELCLKAALPLLAKGERPQVMAVLSRYSAQQLYHPTQPASASNSLVQWLRDQRASLKALGIHLTLVAPQPLNSPLPLATPEDWTPERTAQELIARLEERQPELVLEVLRPDRLWPLPE
ncbi:SDR family NAD(P)-dependent oxidoreductase [Pseudomonas xanthosomatis]|uniref:SDR family NAD(P)-dependent oxidoreductase n=1 Tax=Pseudomonas xanthosomatis TaxID=2842356 RepID=UPI001C3E2691|nr:SDR family NAD(P)-dependent oxidoreductase [Pseudomonas xanthosomatis]QXH46184.1 SDR family NAD(P)-dependent oxidoreductase [Pseudomonas xanthosomatis]